jgi:hypothetical protein
MEIQYGVCRLSIVSVRKDANHLSQQVTQLLFGDHYEVLHEHKDRHWVLIRTYFDKVEGWIESKQHHAITKEYFDQINTSDFKITTDVCATILYKKTPVSIVLGSVVPISQSELFKMEEQFAFNGEAKALGQKREIEFVKTIATKYLNAPEQEGGKSPFGIDGIGLVQMVYKISGYHLPHNLHALLSQYKHVKGANHLGDILFLNSNKEKTQHLGLLIDEDKVMHIDGKVRVDQIVEEGLFDPETKILTHQVEAIIRIIGD